MPLPRDVSTMGERPKTIADLQETGELALALGHVLWRNNLVAKVLCYLSVMRSAGLVASKSKALISPDSVAVPQDYRSTGTNQAAHYLPGFVAIEEPNAKPRALWDLASGNRARQGIENLFRATQDLRVSYNQADSAAEAHRVSGPPGLKQLFGECCQLVIDQRPPRRLSGDVLIVVDRPLVARVFRRWADGSTEAYRHAARQKAASIKRNRPADVRDEPRTDLAKGTFREWTMEDLVARSRDLQRTVQGRKSSVQDFADQESFLRAYANVTNNEFPLSESVIHDIEIPFQTRNWSK